MAYTLKDYYNTNDTTGYTFNGTTWLAQTFAAGSSYDIARVGVKLYKAGSATEVTVSIRATSGGLPTGDDLCSAVHDITDLTTDPAGEWRYADFATPASLTSGTTYAIVIRVPPEPIRTVYWRYDYASGYGGGSMAVSSDSGSSWEGVGIDAMFETYAGDVAYEDLAVTGGGIGGGSATLTRIRSMSASGGGSGGGSGILSTINYVDLAVTGGGSGGGSASLTRQIIRDLIKGVRRLVALGSDELWYEED